jgi:hypothetical protein
MPSSSLASSDPKPQPQPPADQDKATNKEELLQLPALPESDPDANIPTLRVGQSLTLESVGPVIINSDGTTRTISNWDTLTEREQEVTWRRIKKRNAERREILEAKQKEMLEQEQEKKD